MNAEQTDGNDAQHGLEEERKAIFGRLASLADRQIRTATLKPQIDAAAQHFREKLSTENLNIFEIIVMGLKRCGVELAHKAPIYATIAGLLTAGNALYAKSLAGKLSNAVSKDLTAALRDGHTSRARRAMRYLVCLSSSGVINPQCIADYLRVLIKAAHYELTRAQRTEKGVHARGPFLADIALSSLPWGGSLLAEAIPEELADIMDTANKIFAAWKSNQWRSLACATSALCSETFPDLIAAVKELEQSHWVVDEALIPDMNKEYMGELVDGQRVQLSALSIPSHSKLTRYSAPRFRLRLVLEDNDVEMTAATLAGKASESVKTNGASEMNGGSKTASEGVKDENIVEEEPSANEVAKKEQELESVVVKPKSTTFLKYYVKSMYVCDIVDNFPTSHVMAAERLLTMPMLANSNNEVVEGLFSAMCAMPLPPYACVYYGILFVDLCKVKDSRLPVKLLSAVETMFQQSGELDPETFDRLTEWFAFHLSNFGYKWNWSDWAVYADPDMVDKFPFRALFCRDVLMRCIRLAYYDQISKMVPEEMKFFLPPKPTNGNTSRFSEDINKVLMEIVTGSRKQPPPIVKARLLSLFPASQNPDPEQQKIEDRAANLARLSALLRSILMAGYKTLSHFDTVAERYLTLLLEMTGEGEVHARRLVAQEVSVFWDSSHLRRMYVLDKLSTHRVIDGLAILDCVLSPDRFQDGQIVKKTAEELVSQLSESGVWEMVRLVLLRACAREDGARLEMTTASHAAAVATEGDMEGIEARLQRAKSGTENAKREITQLLLLAIRRLFVISDMLFSENAVGMDADMNGDGSSGSNDLPGFNGAPLWAWRAMGMIRELGRKHPRHIGGMLDMLREETEEFRKRHSALAESFTILEEVASCDILRRTC